MKNKLRRMTSEIRQDKSFDKLANKFSNNIYGKSKGKLRQDLLMFYLDKYLELSTPSRLPIQVLDAGGGTGVMTKALLSLGHHVVLNDISHDCLQQAESECEGLKGLTIQHQEIMRLSSTKSYDLVLCHAVMEWLSSPYETLNHLMSLVKVGGHISLSFFNKDAHLFGNVLYGNFEYINNDLSVKNRVALNPQYPLSPRDVLSFLNKINEFEVIHTAGIRCFHDYLKPTEFQETRYDELKEIELRYGQEEPYKWLGKYFHVLLKRVSK
jgi:S-adenosylmethionine-dependent methyltransferase